MKISQVNRAVCAPGKPLLSSTIGLLIWIVGVLSVSISTVNSAAIYPTYRQSAYLKALNSGAGDSFGTSVSLSGDVMVVGAPNESSNAAGVDGDSEDDNLQSSGAAYVFRRNSQGVWAQEAYLKASNPDRLDSFGMSVSISGDTLIIGARDEDSSASGVNGDGLNNNSARSGAAYVFRRDGAGVWRQEAYLKAANAGPDDQFGWVVAASGDAVVVGSRGESSSATGVNGDDSNDDHSFSGAAYVFRRNSTGEWTQEAYLKASNSGTFDFFGTSLSLSGNTLLVGARGERSNATGVNGNQLDDSLGIAGAAYVFTRDNAGHWHQEAYLKASNTEQGDVFGGAVAVSGSMLVVGAQQEAGSAVGVNGNQSDNGTPNSGAAYVFRRDTSGHWVQEAYLKASNTDAYDSFGVSVAISGETVVVGAVHESSDAIGVDGDGVDNSLSLSGAAYVFKRNSQGEWSQLNYLKAANSGEFDNFGLSVSVSGETVVIGARSEDSSATGVGGDDSDNSAVRAGAAYVFDIAAGIAAQDDTAVTVEEWELTVPAPGVLANDSGASLMAELDSGTTDGTLILSLDGAYTYVPDDNFSGTDSFTYRATDGVNTSEISTVTIEVLSDIDGDGVADINDDDDDNDGVADSDDIFPQDPGRAVSCDPGFFGAFACSPAQPGFFVAESGQLSATECPAGTFSAIEGAGECTLASPGSFVADSGQVAAAACPAGRFSSVAGAVECTLASPGSFVANSGQASATECPAGRFSAVAGAVECTLASPGSFVANSGQSSSTLCPAGTFSAIAGAVACNPAMVGTYVDTAGASEALSCPAGTTTLAEGSDSIDDCIDINEDPSPVTVYQHVNFNGTSLAVDEGEVTIGDLRASSVGNDVISSIEISAGYEVYACQHSRLRGRCVVFTSSVSDLRTIGFNDVISSMVVRPAVVRPVTVYQHVNFNGHSFGVEEGDVSIRDLRRSSVGNDVISSIEIAPGYEVYACQHSRFRGRCETFMHSVSDLRDIGFNDVISSFRVRRLNP